MEKLKRIERITALLLALVLVFSMAACSKGEKAAESPAESSAPEETEPPAVAKPENTEPPAIAKPDSIDTPKPEEAAEYTGPELPETEDAGQAYQDSIIFLGDSTTYGLKVCGILSGGTDTKQVWTPASGTLTLSNQSFATIVYPETGEEIPIRDAVERAKPALMVITLGVNGVSFLTEEGFTSEYTSLVSDIKEISPDTKIILNSIYPVQSDYKYLGDINNEKITAANGWIKAIAENCEVKYLETYPLLLGSDGFLNKDYGNGDGIHLNSVGFEIILNNIRTHAYK